MIAKGHTAKNNKLNKRNQPIAIVGMACRFPGGCDSPDNFWELLKTGQDIITEVNDDRWSRDYYFHPDPKSSGKSYTSSAGQLSDIYQFDPEFFGISPREAAQMDPQQRLLLQMSWEALEDGGQLQSRLSGTNCSVYIGVSSLDYANNRMDDPNVADAYFMTGNTLSIAANRISYIYDLHGPSMAIDTACSSSLVALHQACSSIWSGESESSIVGAVHLVLSPFPFIGFSKANMLSKDGRCRVFDAGADGYVRSEGGVVFYLKPLNQTIRDNDQVHAVIRGTAVNSDGNKSALTVPNGSAQSKLLENVYSKVGIKLKDVDYIEAHGTGTPVGDPIEAEAIGRAIGKSRKVNDPLLIGSVKSNIGHLEPASGFAGLLKVILSVKNRAIPATIHQQQQNPNIDFNGLNLKVVDDFIEFKDSKKLLVMGVNSFGFGGTNAHSIIEEFRAEMKEEEFDYDKNIPPLYLSARSDSSLKQRAAQFNDFLNADLSNQNIYNIFYNSANKRERMRHSIVAFGDTVTDIKEGLSNFSQGIKSDFVIRTDANDDEGDTAFVFSGNGSQWQGMGKSLLQYDIFANTIRNIDTVFEPLSGWSIKEALLNDDSGLEYTEVAQPLLFSLQIGVVELLKSVGIAADAVVGHSVGEIAGAYVSGHLTLDDAIKVIYHRSCAQGNTRGEGRMAVVRMPAEEIETMLESYDGELEVAAINSENSVTLSGSYESIQNILDTLREQSVFCRELDIDYAFHSKVMDEIKRDIEDNLSTIKPICGDLRFVSTVTGKDIESSVLDCNYWWDNIRQPVKFGPAISSLIESGTRHFIEIGPHPVLQSYVRDCLRNKSIKGTFVKTLTRNDQNEYHSILGAAYKILFSHSGMSTTNLFPINGDNVTLPLYPWDNSKYVFTSSIEATNKIRSHPLLGFRQSALDGVWINQIDILSHPYLADHLVDGLNIFPAAGFAEMALAASHSWFNKETVSISNLEIRKPLILEQGKTKIIQFFLSTKDLHFSIKSRDRLSDDSWIENASGKLVNSSTFNSIKKLDIESINKSAQSIISDIDVYHNASLSGMDYGEAFRGVKKILLSNDSVLTEICLPEKLESSQAGYFLHPVIMDSTFHTLFSLTKIEKNSTNKRYTYLPTDISSINFKSDAGAVRFSESIIHSSTDNLIKASFILYDKDGQFVAEIKNCLFRKLPRVEHQRLLPAYYYYNKIPKNLINPYISSPIPTNRVLIGSINALPDKKEIITADMIINDQVMPLFDAMASAIAEKTFRKFGAHLGQFTVDSLISTSSISTEHKPYLINLLNILEEDGKAVCHDDHWKMIDSDEIDDPVEIWRSILADYPEYVDLLRETAIRSLRVMDFLTGHQSIEAKSFRQPLKSSDSGMSIMQHNVLHILLETIRQEWPKKQRRLRIAEIRNNQSVSSIDILSQLPEQFCDYEILAMDDYSVTHAEEIYKDHVNVTVSRFAPSTGGLHQKYREGEFDIVLLSHGLHRCLSLTDVFSEVSYILASSGLLVLLEKRPDRITDINMGLANNDWWHRSTDNDSVLSSQLHPDEWVYLLENTGFEDAINLMDELASDLYRFVLVARRPSRAGNMSSLSSDKTSANVLITCDSSDSTYIAQLLKAEAVKDGIQSSVVVGGDSDSNDEETVIVDLLNEHEQLAYRQILESQTELPTKIIYLAGTSEKHSGKSTFDIGERISRSNMRLVNFIKVITSAGLKKLPSVWVVTSGAVSSSKVAEIDYKPNPNQSGLWSLCRVIRNEYPDIDLRMIDLQTNATPSNVSRMLWNEVLMGDGEEEVILNDTDRNALRLDKYNLTEQTLDRDKLNSINKVYRLDFSRAGSIENLQWRTHDRKLPSANEIEIEVRATGLNFRDIMFTSGFLPAEMLEGGLFGASLGLECSGVVTGIGDNIDNIEVGDEVIALAPACFSSHVIASKFAVTKKPESWSFEAAATVPTIFFTIYYALNYLARLRHGERILIHGAAGGVGLAAIQYAHHCGAEIFATAGTPEKRNFLELLGVNHVLDSRGLDFADEILEITNNEGVDIILNSLAGEAMSRNFDVLRPFGRFLELGKRDFYENTKMDLKPFRNNITYYGIDADQLLHHEPELSKNLMEEIMELFDAGIFRPLPFSAYNATDIESAFRYMQQSQQIGKVVVSQNSKSLKIKEDYKKSALELDSNGTYLVTGGLSGFGLATAKWLVSNGARHLVLLSRSGIKDSESGSIVEKLVGNNIDVKIVQCDITDAIRIQSVLHEIQETDFPLKGVIHAAMVLDDNFVKNVDYDSMYNVIAPKVQGAWNLHRLTREYQLDLFILYSSVTTCIGNPGQANYVSANAFLESLAKFRKKSGLAATVISWDAITDTGYLARNEKLAGRLTKRLGLSGITTEQAFEAMETLILSEKTEMIVFNANWSALKRALPILNSNIYKNIMHGQAIHDNLDGDNLIELLARLQDSEKQPVVVNFLIAEIARILQMPEEKIAHNCTIQDLGIDSLMAMELASTIEMKLGIDLPVMTLADNVTLDSLANRIINMLGSDENTELPIDNVNEIVTSLAKIHAEDLSEEELKLISRDIDNDQNNSKRLIK